MTERGTVVLTLLAAVFMIVGIVTCIARPHPAISIPLPWWVSGPALILISIVTVGYLIRRRVRR